jgi:hypothetical protein
MNVTIVKACQARLYPDRQQEWKFRNFLGQNRLVYSLAIEQQELAYQLGHSLTYKQQANDLPELKQARAQGGRTARSPRAQSPPTRGRARKVTPLLAAAVAGALVALVTNLAGLSNLATMLVGALVLIPVVAIGTPLAFGVNPAGIARSWVLAGQRHFDKDY